MSFLMNGVARLSAGAFVCAVFAAAGCGTKGGQAEARRRPPPVVAVEQAKLQAISRTIELSGEVVALDTATVGATVEGVVAEVPVREGDAVRRGDLLVRIDRQVYIQEVQLARAAVSVAEARLADMRAGSRPEEIAQAREAVRQAEEAERFASADIERVKRLAETGALPTEALEKARVEHVAVGARLAAAKERFAMIEAGLTRTQLAVHEAVVEEARARLSVAEARLAECTVRSPFAGVVAKVHIRPGDLAAPRTLLIELFDPESIAVRFAVPERDAGRITRGAQVAFSADALPGTRHTATIERVYPMIDRKIRTRTVEAKAQTTVGLAPGMFARVTLPLETASDAVVVSNEAVVAAGGGLVIFVAAEGKAERREVTLGVGDGSRVQVLSGVSAGERVIVAGNQGLRDGAEITLSGQGGGSQ